MDKSVKTTILVQCLFLSIIIHAFLFVGLAVTLKNNKKESTSVTKKQKGVDKVVIFQMPKRVAEVGQLPEVLPKSLKELPQEVLDKLTPKELEKLEKKIEEKKPNTIVQLPSQRFERTTAAQQTAEKIPETNLYGARDTIAKSDAQHDVNAVLQPAVSGSKNPAKRDIFDSSFSAGEIGKKSGSGASEPIGRVDGSEASESKEKSAALAVQSEQRKREAAEAAEKEAQNTLAIELEAQIARLQEHNREVELAKKIAREKEAEEKIENALKKSLSEQPNETAVKSSDSSEQKQVPPPKKGKVDQSKDPFAVARGMSSEVIKSGQSGSLSRRGSLASRNVKSSELGKYQSAITRAVELKWRKECQKYADRLLPGQLTMKFLVDSRGDVVDIVPIDENAGSGIQKGITLNAIRNATIPAMPKTLKNKRNGAPIDVTITFNF